MPWLPSPCPVWRPPQPPGPETNETGWTPKLGGTGWNETKQGAEHGFNENVVLYGFYMVLKIFYTVWYRCYISFSLLYFLHVWIGFILFYISWLSFVLFCTSVLLFYMVYTCLSCLYGLTVVNNGGFMIEFHQQLMNTNGQSMVACMMLVRHLWTEWGGIRKPTILMFFFE